ncbi:MAG: 3-isopropylmalate dehydratase [Desulfobulbaceae bacterium BRH_c16a]|nr:MAG: 3-isopropylmalate dehydratase [Desulfobulbaceae bacterium BRH_c16a]
MIIGKAITFGANIDTDQIIGAHHLTRPNIEAMAPYAFEHYPPFKRDFTRGDIIVGADNFGCGSSREQAPAVLKERGVAAIVAQSFARIFFRNAINLGIPLIECPEAGEIKPLEQLEIDHDGLRSLTTGRKFMIVPLPPFIRAYIDSGGVVAHLRSR